MRYVILWTHVQKRRISGAVFSLLFLYFKGGPTGGKGGISGGTKDLAGGKGGISGGKRDLTGANDDFSGGNKVLLVRLFIEAQKV